QSPANRPNNPARPDGLIWSGMREVARLAIASRPKSQEVRDDLDKGGFLRTQPGFPRAFTRSSNRELTSPRSLRAPAKQSRRWHWIDSAYAQGRFGGLQARHSSHSGRRRVVATLLTTTSRGREWRTSKATPRCCLPGGKPRTGTRCAARSRR